ncbi:fatty acid desaturase CarF family protein [Variovorax sp. OV329]|uniref:fatty acid desaturase CarF family protein n=1 Tax=Variovorax sp. OV329 TaxID=1882825 RepID=UPI000B81FA9B|nr:fatty acid desaturase CarF family protein [Variovorax sp. OV329]
MQHEIVQCAGAVLLADFFSGLVHWAEDAYVRADTPWIGRSIGTANEEHHQHPRAFVSRTWWASSWDLVVASGVVVLTAAWIERLSGPVWTFAIAAGNANQVHKWAHRAPHENGRLITWLQKCKPLQTQRHHARHHCGRKDTNYCSITNFLNPLLDRLKFWTALEWSVAEIFGLHRRTDITVKPGVGSHR